MPSHNPIKTGYMLPDREEAAAKRAMKAKKMRLETQNIGAPVQMPKPQQMMSAKPTGGGMGMKGH